MVDINEKLLEDINSNAMNLEWENEEGLTCCTTLFNGVLFMICKYNNEKGQKEVSFNQLDKDGYVVEPFNEFAEEHPFFELLSGIYDIAWKQKIFIAV